MGNAGNKEGVHCLANLGIFGLLAAVLDESTKYASTIGMKMFASTSDDAGWLDRASHGSLASPDA